jgi:hypothetical protein
MKCADETEIAPSALAEEGTQSDDLMGGIRGAVQNSVTCFYVLVALTAARLLADLKVEKAKIDGERKKIGADLGQSVALGSCCTLIMKKSYGGSSLRWHCSWTRLRCRTAGSHKAVKEPSESVAGVVTKFARLKEAK